MGLDIVVLRAGDGETFPVNGSRVTFHYVATRLEDGVKFDSSIDRRLELTDWIGTNKFLRGVEEGLLKMSLGEKARLTMTPDLAFGARGNPPVVPPNASVVFVVELLNIEDPLEPTA